MRNVRTMKRGIFDVVISSVVLLGLFACGSETKSSTQQDEPDPWQATEAILERISKPEFRDVNYPVSDFGAIPGDDGDDLPAFTEAIAKCNAEGGGRVLVSEGKYFLKGPIHLLSNVNLAFEEGAEVAFSNDPTDFLPVVFTRWEGAELYNFSPLVYAYEQENIAVTGPGLLDGMADDTHWWPWKGGQWQSGDGPNQGGSSSRDRLIEYNRSQVPVKERVFGDGSHLRPNFVQPYKCKNVYIEGITLTNSPMWVVHPVLCENVIVENITVDSHGPNNDGCNPESCKDVLIQNCNFDTGDDCIALKSGRNQDGRRIARPTENVIIRNCRMKDGHGGVVIGSEVSGGCRNIFAEDCEMDSPNLDRAIRVKTNR